MGKRSRRRQADGAVVTPPAPRPAGASPHARTLDRRARMGEAPPAPWSPFPLVELCILIGLVMIVAGFLIASRRGVLLSSGFALVCLSALELTVREHFSGYRSHSGLLAAVCAVLVDVPLFFFTNLPQEALLGVAPVVFVAVALALRRAFSRRAGGLGFRA